MDSIFFLRSSLGPASNIVFSDMQILCVLLLEIINDEEGDREHSRTASGNAIGKINVNLKRNPTDTKGDYAAVSVCQNKQIL